MQPTPENAFFPILTKDAFENQVLVSMNGSSLSFENFWNRENGRKILLFFFFFLKHIKAAGMEEGWFLFSLGLD